MTVDERIAEEPHCAEHVGDWAANCQACIAARAAVIAREGEWTIADEAMDFAMEHAVDAFVKATGHTGTSGSILPEQEKR